MKQLVIRQSISIPLMKCLLVLELILALLVVRYFWQLDEARQRSYSQFSQQQDQWRSLQQSVSDLNKLPAVTLVSDAKGNITGLDLQFFQPLDDWHTLLTALQQQFWLVPRHLHWRRDRQQWFADISLQFQRPATLKPEHNWLPVSFKQSDVLSAILITTLQGERSAALIKFAQQEVWLHEGSWLPDLHATLMEIEADYVVLQDVQGKSHKLVMQGAFSPEIVKQEAP